MGIKFIAYKKEPIYHGHRYIATIYKGRKCRHLFFDNLKAVNEHKKRLSKNELMEVFGASHEFKFAVVGK